MFICNLKINTKKLWKITLVILTILIVVLIGFVVFKILNSGRDDIKKSKLEENNILEITSEEYTNFLKDCHENINSYIDKKIKIIGYVYRLPDFNTNEFVIARTMIINDTNQAVVVGMLAECFEISKYDSGTWIEVTGTIKKGNYNGEIPIVETSNIKSIKAPTDEFVHSPSD